MTRSSTAAADATSDRATAAFVRRTLCAQHPRLAEEAGEPPAVHELLPPLTSSNEIDLQLYALIAVVIKDFVQGWYQKITPDHVFVDEIVHIIAHCTRALEQRLRRVDLESLVLEDLPALLAAHFKAVHVAEQASQSPPSASQRVIYHTLRPHPALYPPPDESESRKVQEQHMNDESYRHLLAQGLLAVLLPTEDVQNPCLYALVSEVLADMILGTFLGEKVCESGFLYDGIRNGMEALLGHTGSQGWIVDKAPAPKDRLLQFGLLSKDDGGHGQSSRKSTVSDMAWSALQYVFLAFGILRVVVVALAGATSLPRRLTSDWNEPERDKRSGSRVVDNARNASEPQWKAAPAPRQAMLSLPLWTSVAEMIQLPARMPWLWGLVELLRWLVLSGPRAVGGLDSRFDRLMAAHLLGPLQRPSVLLPPLLRSLRATLLPGNAVPMSAASSSAASNVKSSRRAAAVAVLNCMPQQLTRLYFAGPNGAPKSPGDDDADDVQHMIGEVEQLLAVFDDPYLNKGLAYQLLDRLVFAIAPEMAERSVSELIDERGVRCGGRGGRGEFEDGTAPDEGVDLVHDRRLDASLENVN